MTDCLVNQDSSTSSSITTETKPTTTDQSTTPVPDSYVNEYNYVVINEKTHVACIAANMTIFMKIPYVTKESKVCTYTLRTIFFTLLYFPQRIIDAVII